MTVKRDVTMDGIAAIVLNNGMIVVVLLLSDLKEMRGLNLMHPPFILGDHLALTTG